MFIYRDEYYYPETTEQPGRGRPHHRQAPQRRPRRRPADLPERVPALPRASASALIERARRARSATATAAASSSTRRRTRRADCRCRAAARRAARARARSARVIPRKYRGVSFDRPPVTRDRAPGTARRARATSPRSTSTSTPAAACGSFGAVGTGKTTLAMLVSQGRARRRAQVAIYSLPRLLAEIRTTFDDDRGDSYVDLLDRLTAVDLLHIDDVGAEKTSPWVLEQLYAIVNARYEERALGRHHDEPRARRARRADQRAHRLAPGGDVRGRCRSTARTRAAGCRRRRDRAA